MRARFVLFLVTLVQSYIGVAQTVTQICKPSLSAPIVVVSAAQRAQAEGRALPPVKDFVDGFAWPDTHLGVVKVGAEYEFFASDGGLHPRQFWNGEWVGNNKYGSITTTLGTLDNPLGTGDPMDVTISPNPDPAANPNYSSYTYMGGGILYQIPQGLPGAGNLLMVYHAEMPNAALYAVLGLASSTDNGQHWTDLGEVIRLNQAYEQGLDPLDPGSGSLTLSLDRQYFYLYFPDWIANGTLHASTTTRVSIARAPVSSVLSAAFGTQPRAFPFQKFSEGSWQLQPGIGGASSDLSPASPYRGYLNVHFNSYLQRYVMLISNDTTFAYAESPDGLVWTPATFLNNYETIAAYPTAVGLGGDPQTLGKSFHIYFTHLPTDGTGWQGGSLRRFTLTCQ